MSTVDRIAQEIVNLSPDQQSEVLDFVEFLKQRRVRQDDEQFNEFSLVSAIRGMENEPELYDRSDISELTGS